MSIRIVVDSTADMPESEVCFDVGVAKGRKKSMSESVSASTQGQSINRKNSREINLRIFILLPQNNLFAFCFYNNRRSEGRKCQFFLWKNSKIIKPLHRPSIQP